MSAESVSVESVPVEDVSGSIHCALKPPASPRTRTQLRLAKTCQHARAKFFLEHGLVKHADGDKSIHLVTNEKKDVHMVKLSKNSCTCYATTNCAHILACRLYNDETIISPRDLTQSLSKLKGNIRGNKASGRKYRDNIPQSVPDNICFVCKLPEKSRFPGTFCCEKFIHNKCQKNHRC